VPRFGRHDPDAALAGGSGLELERQQAAEGFVAQAHGGEEFEEERTRQEAGEGADILCCSMFCMPYDDK
jgi:hypothetical protein